MKSSRWLWTLLLMATLSSLSLNSASAQSSAYGAPSGSRGGYKGGTLKPSTRPAFSPYLNLLRDGNSTLQNYYGLVRPQQDFRATNEQFQSELGSIDRGITGVRNDLDQGSTRSASGHNARFLSDMRGGPGSPSQTLTERDGLQQKLPQAPGSRLSPTGHGAYFGNTGSYYPTVPGR